MPRLDASSGATRLPAEAEADTIPVRMSDGGAGGGHAWEVVGLVPAAGRATRIGPLPCSKEVYPVGFRLVDEGCSLRPKVACHYLLEKMRLAGVSKAYVVLREGKWDIPAYLGDGTMVNMHLAYLMTHSPFGVPYTLDQAYPFVQDALVAFGFPDILFQPDDAFTQLLASQISTNEDIVLGLFHAHDPAQMDMVEIDEGGRVHSILLKPPQSRLRYAWLCAVWKPTFTHFLHDYLAAPDSESGNVELSVGAAIQAAINRGLRVRGVPFAERTYLDIGSPQALVAAVFGWRNRT